VPTGSRGPPQRLDSIKCLLSFETTNDLTERGGKPAHVFVEREVLFTGRGRGIVGHETIGKEGHFSQ